jgi:hypothetical protein
MLDTCDWIVRRDRDICAASGTNVILWATKP